MKKKLTALIILDGYGKPKNYEKSGIIKENTTNFRAFQNRFPHTYIRASEEYVGLPKGQAGTSEVGHMTLGSGRVSYQMLVRIDKDIKSGEFFKNKELLKTIEYCKKNNKALHLVGLPSDGGIHSHINHLLALIDLCKNNNFYNVFIHFVGDGRDTHPKSIIKYLEQVDRYTKRKKCGKIVSIIGRFYAFDRDKNYDRNKLAYNLWVLGEGEKFVDYHKAVEVAYKNGETDEFIKPICLTDKDGLPLGVIKKGDAVISYNFRTDRERQLAYVMAEENDLDFVKNLNLYFVTMTEYDEKFKKVHIVYKQEKMKNILSEVISKNGLKQVKIAETEKYAHLTFFFNDGKQDCFDGEDRILINSEKMQSYASFPQMSAEKIADKALECVDKYDFIAINFANCDMVGHSGDKEATRKAVKVVDNQMKRVVDAILSRGGQGIVTADHGNADIMQNADGSPNTAHTTSVVPLFVFGVDKNLKLRKDGSLSDVAPTLLDMMGIKVPKEMTGRNLFLK